MEVSPSQVKSNTIVFALRLPLQLIRYHNIFSNFLISFPEMTPKQAKLKIQEDLKHQVNYSKAYRSLRILKMGKERENEKTFNKICPFFEWNLTNNPGTGAEIGLQNVDEGERFLYLFFCPSICANAFKFSLPLIFLDACHSKSAYKGVLLLASTITQNNEIVPLALGIAPVENEFFWSCFLRKLNEALNLNDRKNLVIFSDREKGILNSVNSILPNACHSLCVVHLERNLQSKFKSNFNKILWPLAKAKSMKEFSLLMEKLKKMSEEAHDYLAKISPECFALPFFPVSRFGHVTSNVAESLNAWIKHIRFLPPMAAVYAFSEFVQKIFVGRKFLHALCLC